MELRAQNTTDPHTYACMYVAQRGLQWATGNTSVGASDATSIVCGAWKWAQVSSEGE